MDAKQEEGALVRTEAREYVTNDYGPYNDAIDASLSQHRALADLLRSQAILNGSKIFLYVAGGLSIIGLTLALIFWLLNPSPDYPSFGGSTGQSGELGELARTEGAKDFQITTSFTIFNTTPTAAGEIVVTAKTFEPEDLSMPGDQYCYMTTSTDVRGAETELAFVAEGEVVVATEDDYLIREAVPLCQFEAP